MVGDQARAILREAKKNENYEGPIHEDDEKAISEANAIVEMAQVAWDQFVRGPEVETILRLAADESYGTNGDTPKKGPIANAPAKAMAEAEARYEEQKAAGGGELVDAVEGTSDPSLASVEPWEAYDDDPASAVIEAINIVVEEGAADRGDVLAHVWAYETANKGRVTVLKHLEKVGNGANQAGAAQAEEPQAPEPDPEPDAGDARPDEHVESDGDGDDEGGVEAEEPAADAEPEQRAEAPEPSAEDRAGEDAPEPPAEDRVPADVERDADYEDALQAVQSQLKAEHMHIPPPLPPGDQPELPMDMTTLSDKELQGLHSAFGAYAYRVGYLMMIEEGVARHFKEWADELTQELLVAAEKNDPATGKPKTMTILEAEVASEEAVRKLRRRQRKHEMFAHGYRAQRDSYYKLAEVLSRQETMRHNEWERSGGGRKR